MPPSKKKPRKWCDVCRGEDELFSCSTCERAFHCECVRLKKAPDSTWRCNDCCEGDDVVVDDDEKQRRKLHDARQQQLNGLKRHCQVGASLNLTQHSHRHSSARSHAARGTLRCMHLGKRAVSVSDITLPWPSPLQIARREFLALNKARLGPFVDAAKIKQICEMRKADQARALTKAPEKAAKPSGKKADSLKRRRSSVSSRNTEEMEDEEKDSEHDGDAAKFDSEDALDEGELPLATDQPSYITATLRPYQVDGVNWCVSSYDCGIGGILGDQMGLGQNTPGAYLYRLPQDETEPAWATPCRLPAGSHSELGERVQALHEDQPELHLSFSARGLVIPNGYSLWTVDPRLPCLWTTAVGAQESEGRSRSYDAREGQRRWMGTNGTRMARRATQ